MHNLIGNWLICLIWQYNTFTKISFNIYIQQICDLDRKMIVQEYSNNVNIVKFQIRDLTSIFMFSTSFFTALI